MFIFFICIAIFTGITAISCLVEGIYYMALIFFLWTCFNIYLTIISFKIDVYGTEEEKKEAHDACIRGAIKGAIAGVVINKVIDKCCEPQK